MPFARRAVAGAGGCVRLRAGRPRRRRAFRAVLSGYCPPDSHVRRGRFGRSGAAAPMAGGRDCCMTAGGCRTRAARMRGSRASLVDSALLRHAAGDRQCCPPRSRRRRPSGIAGRGRDPFPPFSRAPFPAIAGGCVDAGHFRGAVWRCPAGACRSGSSRMRATCADAGDGHRGWPAMPAAARASVRPEEKT